MWAPHCGGQKGRVGAKWLNLKSEINLYRLILGCNAAKKK